MADIPVAQVVPMQDNDNLPIAREYVPPFPVSMFDLVPGRRYRISNREITPIQRRQHYPEGQHIFEAVFICLTTAIPPLAQTHYAKFSAINFFDKLEDADGMAERNTGTAVGGMLMGENVYPIFSYEQGLTPHQLEDLTEALDIMSAPTNTSMGQIFNGNAVNSGALPGLLYYGHDTHAGGYRGRESTRNIFPIPFVDRNFRYLLFKHFVEENEKLTGARVATLNRRFNRGWPSGYPENVKSWWQLGLTDLYFNDQPYPPRPGRIPFGNPPLTRLQNHILKNTRPMIIFPSNWSIIDSHYWNPPPAVTGVVRPAIERGRRRLDGGRRIKTKKKRKKQKTKRRKRRRKMRARAK